MKTSNRSHLLAALLALPLIALSNAALGAATDLSNTPISGAAATEIKPNILFIMDDSYSMSWTYLPDWAGEIKYAAKMDWSYNTSIYSAGRNWLPDYYQKGNPDFNGIAYNPKVTYFPPSYFGADGLADTTNKYPSMSSGVSAGWTKVPYDGYHIQDTALANKTANLVNNAYYYQTVPGEFCKDDSMRDCMDGVYDATTGTYTAPDAYPVPVTLRWCQTLADATKLNTGTGTAKPNCQSVYIDSSAATAGGSTPYMYPRMPSPRISTFEVTMTPAASNFMTADASNTIKAITVNGKNILSAPVTATSALDMAKGIVEKINACTNEKLPTCDLVGYEADYNTYNSVGGVPQITISASDDPGPVRPVVVREDNTTVTLSALTYRNVAPTMPATIAPKAIEFSAPKVYFAIPQSLTSIGTTTPLNSYSTQNSYSPKNAIPGYIKYIPITGVGSTYNKADTRDDCKSIPNKCSYAEEMENYANWHAYYRTRMQAMKTAASRSFEPIDDKYRIGYFSINNNTGTDFQNIMDFGLKHKKDWYDKLFDATPMNEDADTPLRQALSQAGWLYAGKYGEGRPAGTQLNGVDVIDPVQYYCQPNVTILSTDGYWNQDKGWEKGFTLANTTPETAPRVRDQDGPLSKEPRPILDNGAGDRKKTSERWYKYIYPGPTWYQKQEVQWEVDRYGWNKTLQDVAQTRTGSLTQREVLRQATTWNLQRLTYRNWWYNGWASSEWKYRTRTLEQQDNIMYRQWMHLQQRVKSQTMIQTGELYRVPKNWYTKTVSKLYQNVKQVTRKADKNSPLEELSITETCISPDYICSFDDNDNWEEVTSGSCVAGGSGVTQVNSGGDNNKTLYQTQKSCEYRNPVALTEKVADCQEKASDGSPYTVLEKVQCTPVAENLKPWERVDSCDPDEFYTCEYKFGPETAYTGGGTCPHLPNPDPFTSTTTICTDNQFTLWQNVDTCPTADVTAKGYAYECQGAVVNPDDSEPAIDYGYVEDGTCNESSATYDANGRKYNCVLRANPANPGWTVLPTGNCTVTKDLPNNLHRYDCRWQPGSWTDYSEGACPAIKQSLIHGSSASYDRECTVTSSYLYQCRDADHPTAPECNHQGWSLENNADSCTSVDQGGNKWADPQIGDVQCRFVSTTDPYPTANSTCTETAPKTPPASQQGNTTYVNNLAGQLSQYKSCAISYGSPTETSLCANNSNVECNYTWSSWVSFVPGSPGATCQATGDFAGNFETPDSKPAGSGQAWNEKEPVQCQVTNGATTWVQKNDPDCYPTVKAGATCVATWKDDWVPVPPPGDIYWDENSAYTSPWSLTGTASTNFWNNNSYGTGVNSVLNLPPYNSGALANTLRFRRVPVAAVAPDPANPAGWWSYQYYAPGVTPPAVIPKTTGLPTAREDDPSPTNAGFCEAGGAANATGVNSYKRTYPTLADGAANLSRETICQRTTPYTYGAYQDACPGNAGTAIAKGDPYDNVEIPNTATARWPVGTTQATVACLISPARTSVIDKECGKQTDGTFKDITYTPYYWYLCSAGIGDPSEDTLADVAEYYYITDLRDEKYGNCTGGPVDGAPLADGVCQNPTNTINPYGKPPQGQSMSTYTLGLGASGIMRFDETYTAWETNELTSGDFYAVWKGTPANPAMGICSWQAHGTPCNWPRPASGSQTNIDDLWHAAVNGRGKYFSAENPAAMATGISNALASVTAKMGSLAAPTVSDPNLSEGNSLIFGVSFMSGSWTGDLAGFELEADPVTGVVTKKPVWSAKTRLDNFVSSEGHEKRKIYTIDTSAGAAASKLKDFFYDNLSTDDKKFFELAHIGGNTTDGLGGLTQLCLSGTVCITDRAAAAGANLVNFLRGDRTNEGNIGALSKYYRERTNLLGDIVNSEAVYVKGGPWEYADNGYGAYKQKQADRKAMVYVGANDGMLHAFYADGDEAVRGQEAWAYVPGFLFPTLYKLADKYYASKHEYYVDGTPVRGDICVENCEVGATGSVWKTILVGGVNRGGRGYYALDITEPEEPVSLWEFSSADDANLGYTYGNPVISKLADGTWVVMFTSGYNNGNSSLPNGDGRGYLYVLNAFTGELILTIGTGEGGPDDPSGLAKISGYAPFPNDNNTSLRVYGGDLLGNVWRFDINDNIPPPGEEAQLLATLRDAGGAIQPITTRPEISTVKDYPVVFIGTGKLLGISDLIETDKLQSLYAIKDQLKDGGYGDPREDGNMFIQQRMTNDAFGATETRNVLDEKGNIIGTEEVEIGDGEEDVCPPGNQYCPEGSPMISVTKREVDWNNNNGWYVDFVYGGERVNTDVHLVQGTLAFVTNQPQTGACVPAGKSRVYFLDYRTGGTVGECEGEYCMAGYLQDDNLSSSITITDGPTGFTQCDGGDCAPFPIPVDFGGEIARRISWRELIVE
ncbi:hypothetical protein FACS1894158_13450 [Betaproteobacteria bacterium]|nr:hypothetical protein FACS1894158_13450 [Betaproteobacteria bacterium]